MQKSIFSLTPFCNIILGYCSIILITSITCLIILPISIPSYGSEPPSVKELESYIKQHGKEKLLKEMSESINKDLPMQMDKNTWVLSTMPISGKLYYMANIVGYPTNILLKEKTT